MKGEGDNPLSFPCDFIFKVIGNASPEFESEVVTIIRNHFPKLGEAAIKQSKSKNGNYLSLSITVKAISQAQLDATYIDLTASPHIIFVL